MRIALNATSLLSPLTGIGQYTYQLAKGLREKQEVELDLFYGNGWSKDIRDRPLVHIRTLKTLLKTFVPQTYKVSRMYQQYRFNGHTHAKLGGLYHEPNFLAFKYKGPLVLTVHDLSWIRFPETHPVDRVRAMNKYFQYGLERASMIITDSQFVKSELKDMFGIADERIKSISLGVEALFRPQTVTETKSVLQRLGLNHQKYILAVGTLEPRKNLQSALLAYMKLPEQTRKHFPLVLVGMKGWNTSALEKQMSPLVAAGEIRLLGYLTREDLATVTAGALTLIYPSIYEGFGLPPLEAMACGVPVIASNVSSLPEVVADTGLLVEPQDIEGISSAIETMISAPELREQASQKSHQRSTGFTWSGCVDQTMGVYRQVLSKA